MNVGIDLGTTYSAVAYFDKKLGEVVVLKNGEDEKITPSVTCVEDGRVYIGNEAKNMMSQGNCNSVAFYKNMMGEDYSFYIDGKEYSAEDISALFLRELKRDIESANGVKIDGAVITVPAYFDEPRRTATLNAGKRAGFNVLKIINEPTAAIIAYGLTGQGKKNAMVYDLGGGTFDVTIAAIDGTHVKVLTTNGDHTLGGKNWDSILFNYFANKFEEEYNIDINGMPEEAAELQVQCEEAKKKLTAMSETTVVVRCSGFVGKYTITRQEFEEKTLSLLNQTTMLIDKCFADLRKTIPGFGWKNIDEVVLVGGSTRMPQVKNMIVKSYGKEPVTKNINVDTIVASGAAMQAELCTASSLTLGGAAAAGARGGLTIRGADIEDITAHSLGMLTLNDSETDYINSIILAKNSKIGVAKDKKYEVRSDRCEVYVLQGETEDPFECSLLYKYTVTGLVSGQKNVFSVSFLYNQNGIVEVTAKDSSGRALKVIQEKLSESLDEIIARLKAEREEMKNRKIEALLIVDVSGSMDDGPIEEAQRAMERFISTCDFSNTSVGIVRFAKTNELVCGITNKYSAVQRAIKKVQVDGVCGYGTNGERLFKKYGREFSGGNTIKAAIVLTDGCWEKSDVAIREAEELKSDGVLIYAVGVGDADYDFLSRIASPGCAQMIDINNLAKAFGDIAGNIAKEI